MTLSALVRTEGGILPADLISRVVAGDKTLPRLDPSHYHLAPGESINEATSRSWTRLRGLWTTFNDVRGKAKPEDPLTRETRERWLLPLFQELGYGRVERWESTTVGTRSYAISHRWKGLPIHLIGANLRLDRRTPGVAHAAAANPHGLLQDFLNRADEYLWGIVSNGLKLRLLRDNLTLTRQAFVEFDLENIFESSDYPAFVMLWLLAHQSRFEGDKPEDWIVEQWSKTALVSGARALDQLRVGVEKALGLLGTGFLEHPANGALKDRLRSGELSPVDYKRQLMRVVYRLLFLFVAEDRGLLLDRHAKPHITDRFLRYYSTARLRRLALAQTGTSHVDGWEQLKLLFRLVSSDRGAPELGLPPLGGHLFSSPSCEDLESASLSNLALFGALRTLSLTRDGGIRRRVDFNHLGAEELGSIYESLLELIPRIVDGDQFELVAAAGNERKTSGSYYTPASLINELLRTTLDPLLEAAAAAPEPEKAILSLKVCDPACGSGHFLVAAAHRIAKKLAVVRTKDAEPAPEEICHSIRDVVSRCLYGVDQNPLSVELCKVSLWLEALDPGKPLAFLNHRIRVGNSLLGATPQMIAGGIPDEAFSSIANDDPKACSYLRRRNKTESGGLGPLFAGQDAQTQGRLLKAAAQIEDLPDDRPEHIAAKEIALRQHEETPEFIHKRQVADTWCAAFLIRKQFSREHNSAPTGITQGNLNDLVNGRPLHPELARQVKHLSTQYQFFHWHLAFPRVMAEGGFSVVLGNPPWEHIELKEKEWFAERRPEIANARTGADRKRMIEELEEQDPELVTSFYEAKRHRDGISHFLGNSGRYPLCGRGRINLFAVFAEAMRCLLGPKGRVGCVLPTAIATGDTTKFFFQDLVERHSLISLFSFFEIRELFTSTDSREPFCLFTAGGPNDSAADQGDYVFFAKAIEDLRNANLHFTLSAEDIRLLNPNSLNCPTFRSARDAELTKAIYRRTPIFIRGSQEGAKEDNPWQAAFKQGLFNMTSDSHLFHTREQLRQEGWRLLGNRFRKDGQEYLPLIEGKLFHHFDHRFASYDGAETRDTTIEEKANPECVGLPRYWVTRQAVVDAMPEDWSRNWFCAFRDITNSASERTVVSTFIPIGGVGHASPIILTSHQDPTVLLALQSNLAALCLDYCARQKISGNHLTYGYLKQLPILSPDTFEASFGGVGTDISLKDWLLPRILELTYTANELQPFANDCGWDGPPFAWNDERRAVLRAEIDAVYFHLYLKADMKGMWLQAATETDEELSRLSASYPAPRDAVKYILDTFPLMQRAEEKEWNEYRTRRVVLEIYDQMARVSAENAAAVAAGLKATARFQTRLNPPPGPPCDAQGNFIPISKLEREHWPAHIHPTKGVPALCPEEVPVAAFAGMAYPSTDTDKAICAAALAVVEQSGGLSSMEHLDALLLATHPDWCKKFLDPKDQRTLDAALRSAPAALSVGQDQSIRWKDCRDYLERLKGLVVSHGGKGQPIGLGAALDTAKTSLPRGVDGPVKCALKALERIRELRKDLLTVPQTQQSILDAFEKQHRLYELAA